MIQQALKVGVIGAGVIGGKRLHAILELGQDKVVAVADVNLEKAQSLANLCQARAFINWEDVVNDTEINAVIVATTTDVNVKITEAALKAGKHVLAEKPLALNVAEAKKLAKLSKSREKNLKVGYNHRHHPAVRKAFEFLSQGKIGKLFYIRAVYGHGARPGYDTEWRMQKKYSFGGELYDQGVHIIDLANWFMGDFNKVFAQNRNFFWKESDLEDNSFCQLFTKSGQVAYFQVSLTQWRNKFLFEIFGSKGFLIINGLGNSYGVETLTLGTEVGQGKTPIEEVFKLEGPDISWREEWVEFKNSILEHRQPLANAEDNIIINKILQGLYKSAKKSKIIKI